MTFDELYQDYLGQRLVQLSRTEFASLITYAPVLMVAVSDANVDHLEMGYLTGLLAEQTMELHEPSAAGERRNQLLQIFMDELKYLLYHLDRWEDPLLVVLAEQLRHQPSIKDKLRVRMVAMAMASRGMNELEQQKISVVSRRLGIDV